MKIGKLILALCCLSLAGGAVYAAKPARKGAKTRTTTTRKAKPEASMPFYVDGLENGFYFAAFGKSFDNLKYGILDSNGNLISPKYSNAPMLVAGSPETLFIVSMGNENHWIKPDGTVIRKTPSDQNLTSIGDGLLCYNIGSDYNKCGLMDSNGNILVPLSQGMTFSDAAEGYVVATKNNQASGIVTRNGDVTVDFKYDLIGKPKSGLVAAVKGDKTGFIDMRGNVVVPFIYDYEEYWGEDDSDPLPMYAVGGTVIVCKNGMWGAVDAKGNVVIPFKYINAEIGSKGTIAMYNNDMEYYFDSNGRKKGQLQQKGSTYGDVDDLHIYTDPGTYKTGYVDSNGRIVISPTYDMAMEFNGPTALVKKGGVWCLIDRTGKIVNRNVARHDICELVG